LQKFNISINRGNSGRRASGRELRELREQGELRELRKT